MRCERQADIATNEVHEPRDKKWSDPTATAATTDGLVESDYTRAPADSKITSDQSQIQSRSSSPERDVNVEPSRRVIPKRL